MTIRTDAAGNRSTAIEVEVPGTPEEVWRAIATGPGISSWFMPAVVEERDGTAVSMTLTFGPGMDSRAAVTAWDPPHRFVKQTNGWMPGSPPIAHEWTVEARAGGTCIVRIVHSLFASTDDWDNQLEATTSGWPAFLRTLELYLTHFRNAPVTLLPISAAAAGTEAEAWDALLAALGLTEARIGERWTAPAGAPAMSGILEYSTREPFDILVRLDAPCPGIAAFGVGGFPGGPTMLAFNGYLYGATAPDIVARDAAAWTAWFREHVPAPADATPAA